MFKKFFLVISVMVFSMFLFFDVQSCSASVSYWKVIGWEMGSLQSPGETLPRLAILVPQDCKVTEPGYGWTQAYQGPDDIYMMINVTDQQVHQQSDGEVFLYYGLDSDGVPIIYYEYGCGIGYGYITLDPTPPCFDYTPSAFTLNGNSHEEVEVDGMEPLILSASHAVTDNNCYFISVQLSDQWWNRYGVEAMDWMSQYSGPYFFDKTSYDIRYFCEKKNFQLVPGNYYRLKFAVSPWHSTTKLVYIRNLVDTASNAVPVMTSNTSPSGIASASSIYSSPYDAWKAFDNDVGWTCWVSRIGGIPAWISYEFTEPKYITGYFILPQYGSLKDRSPKNWTFQGWDGTSWVLLDTRTNIRNDIEWNSSGLSFIIKNPGLYSKYRLYISAVNGSSVVSIRQLKLLTPVNAVPVMTSNTSPSGIASASSIYSPTYDAWKAFDNPAIDPGSCWISSDSFPLAPTNDNVIKPVYPNPLPTGGEMASLSCIPLPCGEELDEGGSERLPPNSWISSDGSMPWISPEFVIRAIFPYIPAWISYEFPMPKKITGYYILPEYNFSKSRSPKNWTLQGWDGTSWVLLDVRKNVTINNWNDMGLYFKVPANVQNPGAYIKYRLYITAVNGSNVVSIRQLKLF
jgi:hypothetical protein